MSCTVKKLLVIFAVCAVAACGGPSDDEDAIREELSDKGTIDLMEEVDKADDHVDDGFLARACAGNRRARRPLRKLRIRCCAMRRDTGTTRSRSSSRGGSARRPIPASR